MASIYAFLCLLTSWFYTPSDQTPTWMPQAYCAIAAKQSEILKNSLPTDFNEIDNENRIRMLSFAIHQKSYSCCKLLIEKKCLSLAKDITDLTLALEQEIDPSNKQLIADCIQMLLTKHSIQYIRMHNDFLQQYHQKQPLITLMQAIIKHDHIQLESILKDPSFDPNDQFNHSNPLQVAIAQGNQEAVQALLKHSKIRVPQHAIQQARWIQEMFEGEGVHETTATSQRAKQILKDVQAAEKLKMEQILKAVQTKWQQQQTKK